MMRAEVLMNRASNKPSLVMKRNSGNSSGCWQQWEKSLKAFYTWHSGSVIDQKSNLIFWREAQLKAKSTKFAKHVNTALWKAENRLPSSGYLKKKKITNSKYARILIYTIFKLVPSCWAAAWLYYNKVTGLSYVPQIRVSIALPL